MAHWTQVSDHCPLGYLLLYVRYKSGVTFIRRSFRDVLIDFRQFLYDSVEKVLFKTDFSFCMTEMRRQTLSHNLNIQCI